MMLACSFASWWPLVKKMLQRTYNYNKVQDIVFNIFSTKEGCWFCFFFFNLLWFLAQEETTFLFSKEQPKTSVFDYYGYTRSTTTTRGPAFVFPNRFPLISAFPLINSNF